jgi:hypothetical protein
MFLVRNLNSYKVGQLTKGFRKKLDGWKEPLEEGQRLLSLLVAKNIDARSYVFFNLN